MARSKQYWRAKQVKIGKESDGVFMTVQSRMDVLKQAFLGFDYNSLSSESKLNVNRAIKNAFKDAMLKMLPLDSETFDKYGMKRRITTMASVGWKVGRNTGQTSKELAKIIPDIKAAASSGNITLSYNIPIEIVNKFFPMEDIDWHFCSIRAKSDLVPKIKAWIERKGVKSNKYTDNNRFAWAIVNAWATNYDDSVWKTDRKSVLGKGGKPDVMSERALRLTLNSSGREAFINAFRKNIGEVANDLTSDVIKKTLKK